MMYTVVQQGNGESNGQPILLVMNGQGQQPQLMYLQPVMGPITSLGTPSTALIDNGQILSAGASSQQDQCCEDLPPKYEALN